MTYHHLGAEAEAPAQNYSEGAFRMGARAMRDAAQTAARDALCEMEWPPQDGDLQVDMVMARIADTPLPTFPEPPKNGPAAWQWWSGSNDEYFTNGPFDTREEAIEALDGNGGFIVEAMQDDVRLSADRLIESQYFENEDYFSGEHGEPDRTGGADVEAAADAELQALLDGWLARWRHTFVRPEMFAASRKHEEIEPEPCEHSENSYAREDSE